MTELPPQISAAQIRTSMRKSIIQRMPEAIETAMKSYMRFIDGGLIKQPTSEAKDKIPSIEYNRVEFKAHHDACRVAIGHINLLLALAGDFLADEQGQEDSFEAVNALTLAVQKAKIEIAAHVT